MQTETAQHLTLIPFLTCCMGFALATLFEIRHTSIHMRWITPLQKGPWACIYWFFIVLVMGLCGLIPFKSIEVIYWIPFGLLIAVHIPVIWSGRGFSRR